MIECIKYIPVNKGHCLGYANLYVSTWDLEIFSVGLYQKEGKRWVSFPSRLYEKNGEKKSLPYLRFRSPDTYARFIKEARRVIEEKAELMGNKLDLLNSDASVQQEIPF